MKKGVIWCVLDVERLEKGEIGLRCEAFGGGEEPRRTLVLCERERKREGMRVEFGIVGRLRRETLDVMREMGELGVEMPGGRQAMIIEFFGKP